MENKKLWWIAALCIIVAVLYFVLPLHEVKKHFVILAMIYRYKTPFYAKINAEVYWEKCLIQ